MNFTKNRNLGRQTVLNAGCKINYMDFAPGGNLEGAVATDTIELFGIPKDAIIMEVALHVSEAFAGATTPTIAVSDDQDTPVDFIAATSIAATGTTLATAVFEEYNGSQNMFATLGGTDLDSLTAGAASVRVSYIQRDRSNEVHE